ncbi:hypothetical protein, partial [Brevibacillus sp. 179-C9.3 HS]|uniref:hypothetical protein n=1 Tax=unclassified Brevibacillus TaxID=2684853 RepID=UPI0039A3A911
RIKLSNKVCYWFKAGKSFNDRLINAFRCSVFKEHFLQALQKCRTHNIPRMITSNQQVIFGVFRFVSLFRPFLKGGLLI